MTDSEDGLEDGTAEDGEVTTMFIRCLPPGLRKNDLVGVLEDEGFIGTFDFVYLITNWETLDCNGEAVVNFRSPKDADDFRVSFAGFHSWPPHAVAADAIAGSFVAEVEQAKVLQGTSNCIERHRNAGIMHEAVPEEFRPLLLGPNGESLPFPKPTQKLKPPRRLPKHVWEEWVSQVRDEADAEANLMPAGKQIAAGKSKMCPFFQKGNCKFGVGCRNAHHPAELFARPGGGAVASSAGTHVKVSTEVGKVCPFFLKGKCKFGDHCKNSHPRDEGSGTCGLAAGSWRPSLGLTTHDNLQEQVCALRVKVREAMLATLDREVQAALNNHWDSGYVDELLDSMLHEGDGIRSKSAYVYSRLAKAPPPPADPPPAVRPPCRSPAAGQASGSWLPQEEATTMFVTGLPPKLTRTDFVELIQDHSCRVGGFNFAYLITNFEDLTCDGKGIVNFRTAQDAEEFLRAFCGFRDWPSSSLVEGDSAEYAADIEVAKGCQGLEHCIERHRNAGIMHEAIPDEYRPQLFDEEGVSIPFPAPTKPLKLPRRLPKHVAQSLSEMNGYGSFAVEDRKRKRTSDNGHLDELDVAADGSGKVAKRDGLVWNPPPRYDSA